MANLELWVIVMDTARVANGGLRSKNFRYDVSAGGIFGILLYVLHTCLVDRSAHLF